MYRRNVDIKEPLSQHQCQYKNILWALEIKIFIDSGMKEIAKGMIRRP